MKFLLQRCIWPIFPFLTHGAAGGAKRPGLPRPGEHAGDGHHGARRGVGAQVLAGAGERRGRDRREGLARRRPGVSRRARVWARALRKCDADGDGELTLDELVRGADDICRLVGIDVGDGSAGRGDTNKKKGNTQNASML